MMKLYCNIKQSDELDKKYYGISFQDKQSLNVNVKTGIYKNGWWNFKKTNDETDKHIGDNSNDESDKIGPLKSVTGLSHLKDFQLFQPLNQILKSLLLTSGRQKFTEKQLW